MLRFLLFSTIFFPSDILSESYLASSLWIRVCQNANPPFGMNIQAFPFLSTPWHIISLRLSWSSSFQAPLCSFLPHIKCPLSLRLIFQPNPCQVSLPNVPTDLLITLSALSPFLSLNLGLSFDTNMVTSHEGLGHHWTVYFPFCLTSSEHSWMARTVFHFSGLTHLGLDLPAPSQP